MQSDHWKVVLTLPPLRSQRQKVRRQARLQTKQRTQRVKRSLGLVKSQILRMTLTKTQMRYRKCFALHADVLVVPYVLSQAANTDMAV